MTDQSTLYRIGYTSEGMSIDDKVTAGKLLFALISSDVLLPVEPDLWVFGEPIYCPTLTDAQRSRLKDMLGIRDD